MTISPFTQLVYEATKRIPRGKVTTYAKIAEAIGRAGASRAVGNALNRNPFAPKVPCHRVIKSDGKVGGFAGGSKEKIKLLKKEGVAINSHGRILLQSYLHDFNRIVKLK